MELKNIKILCLGDSITEGVGASIPENVWHQVLAKNCGITAINYGISGTRFANQLTPSENLSYDQNFISRVDAMDTDADVVLVFGGTNDYGHGDAPFGTADDRNADTFCGACHVLMQKLINKYPDIPVIFILPLHRTDDHKPSDHPYSRGTHNLMEYVDAIKDAAACYSIPVIDLFRESGMCTAVPAQNELYFTDGLHPTDKGHAQIAKKVESFLRAL